jgi:GNAT superfamily N-acetyltransferase
MEGLNGIRHIRVDEFEDLVRFIERCFGHSLGFFPRTYPHVYQPDETLCRSAFVVAEGGRFRAHVGLYPARLHCAGIDYSLGGIGAVASLPQERGQGLMSRLLTAVIHAMREQGLVLSALGGDRQRYGAFGWDYAGLAYTLNLSTRSLQRAGVTPVAIRECPASEIVPTIQRLHTLRVCNQERPRLALQLQKSGLRLWAAPDGYAISTGENGGTAGILEAYSASGNEVQIIQSILDWTSCGQASWRLSAWETDVLARAMPAVANWTHSPDWTYRINDLIGVFQAAHAWLKVRAATVADFQTTLAMREFDRTTAVTLANARGVFSMEPAKPERATVTLEATDAVRLLFGGPPSRSASTLPPALLALLPLPLHTAPLDHI